MMEMRFSTAAGSYRGKLQSFTPYPKGADREAYRQLPLSLKEEIIMEAESFLDYSFPPIKATDFMQFKRTGNRVDFENLYFTRRHALNALVLGECVEHEGRFLDGIINGIFSLCEESGWVLPPHNSYVRDEPQQLLPDATRPVLDLFACETGAMLAYISYLLQEELDEISPFITLRITHELNCRMITPYLQEHFWWMGRGDEPMCNWTVWCTQNVLLTAFVLPFPEHIREKVFHKAALSCDYFLKEYGVDGCCDEGAQYYRHAGLCLYGCMDILNYVAENAFAELWQWDKLQNIASYIQRVHVEDKYYINFADCSPIAGRSGVREFLFGKDTRQPELMLFASRDYNASDKHLYGGDRDKINMYYLLQTCFHHNEVMSYDQGQPLLHQDVYYESVGLWIVRSDAFCLAAKAGDNADSHNHNDTGSFTIYKNGLPLFIDIGVESYTQKTFSPQRYEIWTMQSGYHNLPTLQGLDQRDGRAYKATSVTLDRDADIPSLSMELASAYPLREGSILQEGSMPQESNAPQAAPSYVRCLTLDKKENVIRLCDQTNCRDVVLNFITYEKPRLENDSLHIGDLGVATFCGADFIRVEVLPITDARLQKTWTHDLYRVQLAMTADTFSMEIS